MPGLDTALLFQRITVDAVVIVIAVVASVVCLRMYVKELLYERERQRALAERLRREGLE